MNRVEPSEPGRDSSESTLAPATTVLSYATPIELLPRRVSGVLNPKGLITSYAVGAFCATVGLSMAIDVGAGGLGMSDIGLIALFVTAIGATSFAFTLTRPLFPPSGIRKKRSSALGFLAGAGSISAVVLTVAALKVMLDNRSIAVGIFVGLAIPLMFISSSALAGVFLRGRRGSA